MKGIRIKRGLMAKIKPVAKKEMAHFYRNVIGSIGGGAVVAGVATAGSKKSYADKTKKCGARYAVKLSDSPGIKAKKLRKFNACMKK